MKSFIITGSGVTACINGKVYNVAQSHPKYAEIATAVQTNDWDAVPGLVDLSVAVTAFGVGKVVVKNGTVYYKGEPVHNVVTNRILSMIDDGYSGEILINFLERLLANPSRTAVEELYLFLEAGKIPLTPDGYILAYKRVNDNFYDKHSNTMLNKPYGLLTDEEKALFPYTARGVTAKIVNNEVVLEMERNSVDDRRNSTCSYGLHFCSLDYLKSFGGGRTVIVKIDPADVVSIPSDYNNTKGRTCRYIVAGELEMTSDTTEYFTSSVMDVGPSCLPTIDDIPVDEGIVEDIGTSINYQDGYKAGYKAGRSGHGRQAVVVGVVTEYDKGYAQGFVDGKGHKRKQF